MTPLPFLILVSEPSLSSALSLPSLRALLSPLPIDLFYFLFSIRERCREWILAELARLYGGAADGIDRFCAGLVDSREAGGL
jgi:hypothetical protein